MALNPFKEPTAYDTYEDEFAGEQGNKFAGYVNTTTQQAETESRQLEKEQHDKKGTDLNKNQNANYAQGQGQYGMINNRDYGKTIKLAREADAYNNKPQDHMFEQNHWKAGGTRDLGTGYDRPQIQTMETRAMGQAFQLDTNQKQLAQQLQDAVNHKDLNAFIQLYQQLYGITLTREQATREFRRFEREQIVQQTMQRNMSKFNARYARYFSAETAEAINDLVKNGNSIYASYLGRILIGMATASQEKMLEEAIVNAAMTKKFGQNWNYYIGDSNVLRTKIELEQQVQNSIMLLERDNEKAVKTFGKSGTRLF